MENHVALPVWMYWEGDCPDWIMDCRKTVFAHTEDLRLITPIAFDKLWDRDRDIDISQLYIAHRADFIRAFLLAKFGGLWVDSDCIVMKPLQPLINILSSYDFLGFRERSGNVANNFMAAKKNSVVADHYYNQICRILRSGQPIEWLTIGSDALSISLEETKISWWELDVQTIQPICWSEPKTFFIKGSDTQHEQMFKENSYCYMLSGHMVGGVLKEEPSLDLNQPDTFFQFLIRKSFANKLSEIAGNMVFRQHSDDDNWIIPELITNDMYRIREVLSKLEPPFPNYVVDCGAHIGAFSVMCSSFFKQTEVLAFEPNPHSFFFLKNNAKFFRNITIMEKAVGVGNGTIEIFAPEQEEWTGRWSVVPNNNQLISVSVVDLFAFINGLDREIFILKLDLEGYEKIIIDHSKKEDFARINTLILEVHSDNFDHNRLIEYGYHLLFQPHISTHNQFVYTKANA